MTDLRAHKGDMQISATLAGFRVESDARGRSNGRVVNGRDTAAGVCAWRPETD